jgi:hypothetical protein
MFHFSDIDRDGMTDMLFSHESEFSLSIYYNKLKSGYDHLDGRVDTSSDNWQLCGDTNRILGPTSVYSSLGDIDDFVVK